MTDAKRPDRRGDQGFTLTELLVVVFILGVIGSALTESIIIGLKTTAATAARVSGSIGTEALSSYFTGDAQSADVVSTSDPACAPGTAAAGVFVRFSWTDQTITQVVSYGLDPPAGGEQDVVRYACSGGGPADRRILAHFSHPASDPVAVIEAFCDGTTVSCPTNPGGFSTVTLAVRTDPTVSPPSFTNITVARRRTPPTP